MTEIEYRCAELNQLIRESEEYKTYTHARNAIKANDDLYNSLMDFKRIYSDILQYTEGNPYDEILRIYNENDDLLHNSTVNEYLRAESAFSKLVRSVIDKVSDGLIMD